MEIAFILVELTRIRILLTVFAIFSAVAVVAALVALSVYIARRYDKWLDAVDREIGQGGD